jgi:type IV pilus assembly protein PilE
MAIKALPRRASAGFTLVELMMVVIIVGVLISIGLPAYQDQAIRAARAGAKAEMLEIAVRQKQFLLSNRAYASKTLLETNGFSLDAKVAEKYTYDITLGTASLPSYTITFNPTGAQAKDGWLAITSEGERTSQYPDKWQR